MGARGGIEEGLPPGKWPGAALQDHAGAFFDATPPIKGLQGSGPPPMGTGQGGSLDKPTLFQQAMAAPANYDEFKGTVVAVPTVGFIDHKRPSCACRFGIGVAEDAFASGAEWVILPEFFTSAVGFHQKMMNAALPLEGPAMDLLKSLAKKHDGVVGR